MAQMIPDRLPSHSSQGEKRLFEIFQRLPDDYIVMPPEENRRELRRFFNPVWPIPPLTACQVDALRSIIHPEIRIQAHNEDQLAVLDLRQECHARYLDQHVRRPRQRFAPAAQAVGPCVRPPRSVT